MSDQQTRPPAFYLLRLAVILGVIYGLGFGLFVLQMPSPARPGQNLPQTDGIVALTGGGGRLGPAVALLEGGRAERLLISGVNPSTTKPELRLLLKGGARFDCCADLGFEAADTRGNAKEAALWTSKHGYSSLIVVTSSDHMLRSMAEFAGQMPDVRLIPYAVVPMKAEQPLLQRLPGLNAEFAKYLASSARISLTARNGTRARVEARS